MKLAEAILKLHHKAMLLNEPLPTIWFTDRWAFMALEELVCEDIGTQLYRGNPHKDWFRFAGVRFAMLNGDLN